MGIQVTELTQGKEPWEKEFIDFEFDGKKVSDFGLVVAFGDDRLILPAFPQFEDETSTINGASGQLYWGTRFKTLTRNFRLVTDGMTEEQLRNFKSHFSPGKYGKFIEPHLLGRYSYCRVSGTQDFQVVPFRKKTTFMNRELLINEYKGEINITFCWDEPFTYSELSIIEGSIEDQTIEDLYKIISNGVPLENSWQILNFVPQEGEENKINSIDFCFSGDKKISSASTSEEGNIPNHSYPMNKVYAYYNPSTYFSKPEIKLLYNASFTEINLDNWQPVYFNNIIDDINVPKNGKPYNSIIVTANQTITTPEEMTLPETIQSFHFTSPSVIYSLHKAIQIAYNFYNGLIKERPIIELEEQIREEITHEKALSWIIGCIRKITGNSNYCEKGILTSNTDNVDLSIFKIDNLTSQPLSWFGYFNVEVLRFFYNENKGVFQVPIINFDSQKSETTISYGYNEFDYLSQDGGENFFEGAEEKSGDMALTPYLNLAGGDSINQETGLVNSCHFIYFEKAGLKYNSTTEGLNSEDSFRMSYEFCYI